MVDKEADKELAEISLEQDMLRELNLKPSSKKGQRSGQKSGSGVKEPPVKVNPTPVQSSGKKTKQGMALDLGAIIDALEVCVLEQIMSHYTGVWWNKSKQVKISCTFQRIYSSTTRNQVKKPYKLSVRSCF